VGNPTSQSRPHTSAPLDRRRAKIDNLTRPAPASTMLDGSGTPRMKGEKLLVVNVMVSAIGSTVSLATGFQPPFV
jgi:hypothetical protein